MSSVRTKGGKDLSAATALRSSAKPRDRTSSFSSIAPVSGSTDAMGSQRGVFSPMSGFPEEREEEKGREKKKKI